MTKKENKTGISRRDLLKLSSCSAFGLSRTGVLLQALFEGMITDAYAQGTNYNKKYIFISQGGAPPRWFFDLPLIPDGDRSKFIPSNNAIITKFVGSDRYTSGEYATTLQNGIHMPWMWQFDIPTANGGFSPMKNLMDGMLMMRGLDTKNPAHIPAQGQHYNPNGIKQTINSLTSDHSSTPISAISIGASSFRYNSLKGYTPVKLSGSGNVIKNLLSPFIKVNNSKYNSDQDKIQSVLETGLYNLNSLSHGDRAENQRITKSMEAALDLFGTQWGDLDTVFNNLVDKYQSLIDRSLDTSRILPGINDKPIGNTGTRDKRYSSPGAGIIQHANVLDIIVKGETEINNLAVRFAVAEFVITNNLTSSVSIGSNVLSKLKNSDGTVFQNYFDEHGTGGMISLLANTYYNMALSSCLYELISMLKSKNMFEDTVIDLCGEFGRMPKTDGSGSDHSAEANSNTLISGSIDGTHVIGNISNEFEKRKTTYKGTWGAYASNEKVGLLGQGHFASTIATLLDLPSPVTAVPSLVKKEGSAFVPILPMGKIV